MQYKEYGSCAVAFFIDIPNTQVTSSQIKSSIFAG